MHDTRSELRYAAGELRYAAWCLHRGLVVGCRWAPCVTTGWHPHSPLRCPFGARWVHADAPAAAGSSQPAPGDRQVRARFCWARLPFPTPLPTPFPAVCHRPVLSRRSSSGVVAPPQVQQVGVRRGLSGSGFHQLLSTTVQLSWGTQLSPGPPRGAGEGAGTLSAHAGGEDDGAITIMLLESLCAGVFVDPCVRWGAHPTVHSHLTATSLSLSLSLSPSLSVRVCLSVCLCGSVRARPVVPWHAHSCRHRKDTGNSQPGQGL
jgi:hypothetical protein